MIDIHNPHWSQDTVPEKFWQRLAKRMRKERL